MRKRFCDIIVPMEHLINLIQSVGYWGYLVLFLVIVLESVPVTFFLPGDSLLFTTGFLASQGHFDMAILFLILFTASVLGYVLSYTLGKKLRDFILQTNDKYWFKKKHIEYTEEFYKKYGLKTIIIGRFVPIVRSFGPALAGAGEMPNNKFLLYTVVGGIFWTGGLTSVGFYLGKVIPGAHLYLTPIIIAIIFVSLIPVIFEYIHTKIKKKQI